MDTKLKSDQGWFPVFYFFTTGGGAMVSWNAMLNSFDYFDSKYPQFHVSFLFPIAIYVAQFLSSLVVTQISAKLPYIIRIFGSFFIVTLTLIFLPFQAIIFEGTNFGFWFLMALLLIVGFCNNICFSSAVGLASQLPGKYTTCIFIGSAIVGLIMGILRQIAAWIFKSSSSDEIFSVAFFFGMAALLIIIALVMQPLFIRSNFYRTHFIQADKVVLGDIDREKALVQRPGQMREERSFKTLRKVCKEVGLPVILLIILSVQTYAVFPGVMEEKQTPEISNQVKIVSMALCFTFSSMIGKLLGQFRQYYSLWGVGWIVIFRFILIVFFVIQAATNNIPVFETLWFGYLNIIAFGLSYGFVTVSLCIIGPEQVSGEKKEVAGYISILALNIGTMAGTFVALPFRTLNTYHYISH